MRRLLAFGGLGLPLTGHLWIEDLGWGYRAYEDVAALTEAYAGLIAQLDGLIETRGLAAAIYTQTTDVESEANGMLTYDRAVIKMGIEQVSAITSGLFGPGG